MSGELREIRRVLRSVRRRWMWHTIFRCGSRAALGAAIVLLAGGVAFRALNPRTSDALAIVVAAIGLVLLVVVARALWPLTRRPTDAQVARFVEERCPQLEDRLVTAVECVAEPGMLSDLLYRDAARRTGELDLDRTISRRTVAGAGSLAVASTLLFVGALVAVGPRLLDGAWAIRALVSPQHVFLRVTPGNATVIAGQPVRLAVEMHNARAGTTPVAVVRERTGVSRRTMILSSDRQRFEVVVRPSDDFTYAVSAGGAKSAEYQVVVLHPASVTSIDVRYQYPADLGLPARTDEGGGDVYAPAGTRVQLRIHTDKPIRSGSLVAAAGRPSALSLQNDRLATADFTVTEDGSYRIALTDADNLQNPGDVEYFIRLLADTPPEVRIVSPAGDRQVTPLEEVTVAAHAEDDRGVNDFDLVYSVRGGPEITVPFARRGDRRATDGERILYLEDLQVRPGDFITYYARARDGAGGGRGVEARSDLFFLEVTPFDQEFLAPQSSQAASGGMSAAGHSLDDLVGAQKTIIVATWRLDRRARKSRGGGSEADVKTVARAQGELKGRAAAMAGSGDVSVGLKPRGGGPTSADETATDAMTGAIAAMEKAEQALNAVNTAEALPHETRALNELLKAQAANRRRQLMQAGAGAGSDNGNNHPDLTTLFDRELQRQQRTNYEMPGTSGQRSQDRQSEALERVRQMAERQGELARQQEELARNRGGMQDDEVKRQLERLTREQSDLRLQAEQLSQQLKAERGSRTSDEGGQQGGTGGRQAQSSAGKGSGAAGLRQASEAMRQASANLREGNLTEAGARSNEAVNGLRSAEQRLRGQQSPTGAPTLGELQMEAQQLADAQQQIAKEAASAGAGKSATDTMRRLAGEKERLADKAENLGRGLKTASQNPGLDGRQRQAADAVAGDFARLQLPRQMREAASAMRAPDTGDVNRPPSAASEQELANTLSRLAGRLGAAAGSRDGQRAEAQLDQTRQTRERLAQLERQIAELQRRDASGSTDSKRADQSSSSSPRGKGGPVGTVGGGTSADRAAEAKRLQDEYARELRRAAEDLNRLGAQGGSGMTPRDANAQSPLGARGFNQDYSKWEELSRQVNAGLERAETVLAQKVREQQMRDRLQAPAAGRAPEAYRRLVEQYYQSLAKKDK